MNTKNSGVLPKEAVRCAIYARTASCSEPENSAAIAQQIVRCRKAAQAKGYRVAEDCIRTDVGKSGNTMEGRAGLQDLIALSATKPRPFAYLICDSTDRLARNLSVAGQIVDALISNGVGLHFASAGLDTADPKFRKSLALISRVDGFRLKGHRPMIWHGMLRCNCESAKKAAAAQIATTPACNHPCADCSRLR